MESDLQSAHRYGKKKLLDRALTLVKPGGIVVYSTCTFAPEENEAVLDAVLGDRAFLEPAETPGLKSQPGLTQWQGHAYRSDLTLARRYFPHFNNTGGFFVARLRRSQVQCQPPAPLPASLPSSQMPSADSLLAHLCETFAIATPQLAPYTSWMTGKRRACLAHQHCWVAPNSISQTWGIPLASYTNRGLKPATAFLQYFGPQIQQRLIVLPNVAAAWRFVAGQSQPVTASLSPGYVHVRFRDLDLGCGYYASGQLQSQLPKALRVTPSLS